MPTSKEEPPIEDEVIMLGLMATYLFRPKPVAMALIWKFRRKCSELSLIGKMNFSGYSTQLEERWSAERTTVSLRTYSLN